MNLHGRILLEQWVCHSLMDVGLAMLTASELEELLLSGHSGCGKRLF